MLLNLDYRSASPLYEQVKDGLRRLILSGVLSEGDRLPSVRELSTQLALNPNTIQRAYRELESEGIILSVGGRGSFVADRSGIRKKRVEELFGAAETALRELRELGIPGKDISERLEVFWRD